MAEYGNLFLGLGVFISSVMSIVTFAFQQKQLKIATTQTEAITELTVHTNGIKDELIKVVGEAEFARGKLAVLNPTPPKEE